MEENEFLKFCKKQLEDGTMETMTLSDEDFDKFVEMLENPKPLSKEMKEAIKLYNEGVSDGTK